jgi:hypothetical protein
MASQVPNHYAQQFANTVQLLLQQEGSVLMPGVTVSGGHKGEQASPVDQYAAIEALKVLGRYEPMPNIEAATDRRWVVPQDWHVPQLIDSFDLLRLLNDPKEKYVQNARNAIGRQYDIEILDKLFGTNLTGKSGTTSTTFPSTQVVSAIEGAASATNLTIAKIKKAKRILRANNVNFAKEQIYCAINAANQDSLLNEVQMISSDFNGGISPLAMDKIPDGFMGITWIHTELLTTGTDDQAGTSTQTPLWLKSRMYLGQWDAMTSEISQRNDLTGLPWQSYLKATFGATRLEEAGVVKIWTR